MNRIDKAINEFLKEADEVFTDEPQSDWETRVRKLEDEGCTRSDAQAIVDAEDQRKEQTPESFWRRVIKTETCWEWSGYIAPNGYGMMNRHDYVHRYSYEIHKGKIPEGMTVDHLCRNRKCVNPDHLEAVTNKENILRGESPFAHKARQTHCSRGHELRSFSIPSRPEGRRDCPTCREETNKRAKERERAPYPNCIGNPNISDCIEAGYCRRNPGCGD